MASSSLILVVDPDPVACENFAMGLSASGWAAEPVSDGREALARAIERRPDAVVTATQVPGLNGFDLCRLLKFAPDTRHIPILMLSDAEETQIAKAKDAGVDTVLPKPCAVEQLIRAIEAMLGSAAGTRDLLPVKTNVAAPTRHRAGSRLHARGETTTPPLFPPRLYCPTCQRPLTYLLSHIGGVNANNSEQWDDYDCRSACGRFQYRQRTRKLRQVS